MKSISKDMKLNGLVIIRSSFSLKLNFGDTTEHWETGTIGVITLSLSYTAGFSFFSLKCDEFLR